jgi:hypothetical protein
MLTKNLDITYAMVWSIALANILGAGMCYAFSPQFAKLSVMRFSLILPAVLGIVYIGAFEATRQWGDLYSLLIFGLIGWIMKQFKWPRPPLILGVVLGDTIERYLFISIERYGLSWMLRPVVVVLSKFDEWSHLYGPLENGNPWKRSGAVTGIDVEVVEQQSQRLRQILAHHCPETVAAAESFATNVSYIAVSSLGDRMHADPKTGLSAIRPAEIQPYWVTVPLLYSLSRILPGLIPRLKRRNGHS